MCSITYITLSYYVNILTYTYNFNKYIYEKISLSLILSIICNALCNFVQPLAYKRVYNDLLQPCFLTFRTYAGRVYRPLPWASRTLILLVTYNRGIFRQFVYTIFAYSEQLIRRTLPQLNIRQYPQYFNYLSIYCSCYPISPIALSQLSSLTSRPLSPYIIYPYISFCPLYLYLLFLNPYVHINPQFFISHHFTVSYLLTPTIYNYI